MITNLVNDLIIVCPNADKGCQSTCPRYLIDGHLKHICEHVLVKCVECDELVMRKDAGECLHKEVECGDCTATVRRLDMEVKYTPKSHIELINHYRLVRAAFILIIFFPS